jgi:hypothetical protein
MSCSSSNLVAAFVDLASFDYLEKFLYGGCDASAYFIKKVRKSTWFTIVPVVLSSNGNAAFGQTWSVNISRAGDYLVRSWLRVTLPAITMSMTALTAALPPSWLGTASTAAPFGTYVVLADSAAINASFRWTRNVGHNLIREASITFNDLCESRYDSHFLDFWAAFTVPGGKINGYQNMIGNVAALNNPVGAGIMAPSATTTTLTLPSAILNIPNPFSHFLETGWALPTAALPYNDMKMNFCFRNYYELLVIDSGPIFVAPASDAIYPGSTPVFPGSPADTPFGVSIPWPATLVPTSGVPLLQASCWAEYALVSNGERVQMGKAPRDLLIQQVQTAPFQTFNATSNTAANNQFQVHFAHAVKTVFFGVVNTTNPSEHSNYTNASPVTFDYSLTGGPSYFLDFTPALASDPIQSVSLYYENTQRLANMGADYFAFVQPYYTCPSIPQETGYHVYNYTLDILSSNAMGSTNYGKLTNVTFAFAASPEATIAATLPSTIPGFTPDVGTTIMTGGTLASPNGTYGPAGAPIPQTFQSFIQVISHNVVRVSGGVLGFPAL